MARRKKIPAPPSALPDGAFHSAVAAIYGLRDLTIFEMLRWDKSADWALQRLFNVHILRTCAEAYDATAEAHRGYSYGEQYCISEVPRCNMSLSSTEWRAVAKLAPSHCYQREACTEVPELVGYAREVYSIMCDFGKAVHVLGWLNRSTPGAMRAYAPWIARVLPAKYKEHLENRRDVDPMGVGPMLPLIREAGTVMATAMLLPGRDEPRPKCGFSLVFPQSEAYAHGQMYTVAPLTVAPC